MMAMDTGGMPGQAPNSPATSQQHHPKVEDALKYLEKVKMQFGNEPHVYDSFLDIMKDFKAQSIDTPGVISRVWELFRGHKDLILGFNTFLPPGYKIELDEIGDNPPHLRAPSNVVPHPPPPPPVAPTMMAPNGGGSASQQQKNKQPKEFNHAINYVNKIKTRFANQPDIYKAFLEILHTYQKEQRTIPEVYAEVAVLFEAHRGNAGCADLLEEFSQFLPDTPNEAHPLLGPGQSSKRGQSNAAKQRNQVPPQKRRAEQPIPIQQQRPQKRMKKGEEYDEIGFFNYVKRRLTNRQHYNEFLKCLNLYSQQIVSKGELVQLMEDLIGDQPDLIDWVKKFINYQAHTGKGGREGKERDVIAEPAAEIDYMHLKRLGTSYRGLPKSFRPQFCSGRDDLCKSVLNDTWVSVPATDTDDFIFKSSQKNEFEERLFKCEDDRYELDMVIEHNLSTLKALEPLAQKIASAQQQPQAGSNKIKLNDTLGVIQLKAIERIYGDKATEVFDGLKRNPHVTIPVVIKRLKQKDEEWRRVQKEWNRVWNEINEQNYQKSLDHHGMAFKSSDRKTTGTRGLLADARTRLEQMREEHVHKAMYVGLYTDVAVLDDVAQLILSAAQTTNVSEADQRRIEAYFNEFLYEFLGVTKPTTTSTTSTSNGGGDHMEIDSEPRASTSAGMAWAPTAGASGSAAAAPVHGAGVGVGGAHNSRPYATDSKEKEQRGKTTEKVFYGNDLYFLFFRLHAVMYERVLKAKQAAASVKPGVQGVSTAVVAEHLNPVAVTLLIKDPKKVDAARADSVRGEDGFKPDQLYQSFLTLVRSLVAGEMEAQQYEDELRNLFGFLSYPLFTLDRVVMQMLKTVINVVNDETCQRLLQLYHYERTRSRKTDSTYRQTYLSLLDDENCYRVRVLHYRGMRKLLMSMYDPDAKPDDLMAEREWADYVQQYIQPNGPPLDPRDHHLFMQRNKRRSGYKSTKEATQNIMANLRLQSRIMINSYKLVFVEGSEDIIIRRGQRKPVTPRAKGKLAAFVDKKHKAASA